MVPQLKGKIHNPQWIRIPNLQRQNLGIGSALILCVSGSSTFLIADPDPAPDPGLFCLLIKFVGNQKFKYNFYTWIWIQQLKLMRIRIRNPGQNIDPYLIWSVVLRYPLYGRNLQLSSRLDHRRSPEPPVVWQAGILKQRNGLRLKNQ